MKLVGYYRGMEVYEDESCPPDTIYFVSKGFEMANAWLTPELMKEFGIEEADMCGPPEWKNIPWRVKASRIRVEIHPNFGEFGVYIDRDEAP